MVLDASLLSAWHLKDRSRTYGRFPRCRLWPGGMLYQCACDIAFKCGSTISATSRQHRDMTEILLKVTLNWITHTHTHTLLRTGNIYISFSFQRRNWTQHISVTLHKLKECYDKNVHITYRKPHFVPHLLRVWFIPHDLVWPLFVYVISEEITNQNTYRECCESV